MATNMVRLAVYSAGHFWVDFSCALLMFSQLFHRPEWSLCVLLYNFCAFALQMPLGLLADRISRNSLVAGTGCILVLAGWLASPAALLSAVLAGVGNACFHIGGGIDVLNDSTRRSAALGVFVSPGAFGIYFGTLFGKTVDIFWLAPVMGLLIFGVLLPGLDRNLRGSLNSGNAPCMLDLSRKAAWVLVCCFVVVILRSCLGLLFQFPWKTGGWSLVLICAVVFGKAAGGFLGDWLGMRRGAMVSLGMSGLLFLVSGNPLAGTAAVFLFNMTMPMTLWAAAKRLPGGKGFAFGTLTFALFLGFFPAYLGWELPSGSVTYALGAVLSLVLLWMGLKWGEIP